MKTFKEFKQSINEGKLPPEKQSRLDDLINNLYDVTDPEYTGDVDSIDIIKTIEKEFGSKIANDLKAGLDKMHFPRKNHTFGSDKLAGRPSPRVTKGGKANKQDVGALKNAIKRR